MTRSSIEDVFEASDLPAVGIVAACDDAGLIDAMSGAVRLERAVAARRLFAVGELFLRREAEAILALRFFFAHSANGERLSRFTFGASGTKLSVRAICSKRR